MRRNIFRSAVIGLVATISLVAAACIPPPPPPTTSTTTTTNTTVPTTTTTTVPAPSGAVAITAGFNHTCALLADGTARCWGDNQFGQLGDGTTTNRTTPVTVPGLTDAVAITAGGGAHTCVLLADGTARCWGGNTAGQLGNGTTTEFAANPTPVAVSGLSGAVAITAGTEHTCALLADGTARCWGANFFGGLGDGTTIDRLTSVAVKNPDGTPLTGVAAITAGPYYTCAILDDGTVRCWGGRFVERDAGLCPEFADQCAIPGLTNVVAIAAGSYGSCAIIEDGTARCWGANTAGQLGNGTTTGSTTANPTPVAVSGLSGAVAITGGGAHTCALLADGTARCWGFNDGGQLGDGTDISRFTPVAVSGLG